MNGIHVYLTFDGNCREAMTFYKECLGGELELMPFAMGEGQFDFPAEAKNRIMHSRLRHGDALIMASDSMPGQPVKFGSNYSVSVNCDSAEEVDRLHAALGKGGKITMPAQDTFWNARFGMVTDRFGVNWMFNHEKGGKK